MKSSKSLMTLCVIFFVMVTACNEDFRSVSSVSPSLLEAKHSNGLSAGTLAKLEKLRALLPADFAKRVPIRPSPIEQHPEYADMIFRAISAVVPTECDMATPLRVWRTGQRADWDSDALYNADLLFLYDHPVDLAYFFENSSANQYFGVHGEYTQRLTKTFKDLKRFWNIQSSDIVLVGMHGKMMYNRDRLVKIFQLRGNSLADSQSSADMVIEVLNEIPQYRKGDHPSFTFNAYSYGADNTFPAYGLLPPKIIMGDGIMEGYSAIGFDDVAPQALLAHEFGHQIQLQLNLLGPVSVFGPPTPEGTRRTELMADAYAAYYLSHARGASMQWKRVKQFLEAFFNIGDCAFTHPNHHGTPRQRMAAAEWGYQMADNAKKQGHILTAEEFTALFETQLPIIVAPVPIPYPN